MVSISFPLVFLMVLLMLYFYYFFAPSEKVNLFGRVPHRFVGGFVYLFFNFRPR